MEPMALVVDPSGDSIDFPRHLVIDVRKSHEKYGDVVRIAPDEVSFAREEAWVDALGGRKPLPRNATPFKAAPGQPDNLVTTDDPEASIHKRQRLQERVARPSDATQGAVVDLVDWFHWFAFDLVGELAFGEAFGCLASAFAKARVRRRMQSPKRDDFMTPMLEGNPNFEK
ncbi:hypothetical protein EKO27_g8754 [Xylaria grammica]|uniref:Uncharacterized protein n=1 Tax=Xylaria grammica TaxID=363999 RepID=A0A439CWD4_9PEZI|nr:hypothetical protein EKO27_g8754 [Xylaria grammica]